MKLNTINKEIVGKMIPCHNLDLYDPDGGAEWEGDALTLMDWVHRGELTIISYMWVILRPAFIPEELLNRFTMHMVRLHLGDQELHGIDAKRFYLDGKLRREELDQERDFIKKQLKNKEDSLLVYRTQNLKRPTPVLKVKIGIYEKQVAELQTQRYASHPDCQIACSGTFHHLCQVDRKYEKLCFDMLKGVLEHA